MQDKMKEKINVLSIFLSFAFLLLPITTIIMLENITISETLEKIDRGYFGKVSSSLAITGDSMNMLKISKVVNKTGNNIAVYQKHEEVDVVSIYFNGEYANIPMLKGRFFSAIDFKESNYVAVIGKNKMDEVFMKRGVSYINIVGEEFEVIGVMGVDSGSSLDDLIYINGLSNSVFNDLVYTFDFMSKNGKIQSEKTKEELEKTYDIEVEEISQNNTMMSTVIPKVIYSRWFVGIILCNFLCIVLLSLEWKNQQKNSVCIKRLLGFSRNYLTRELGLKYSLNVLITGVISLFISAYINDQYRRFFSYGIFALILFISVFTLYMVFSLMNIPIEEEIK